MINLFWIPPLAGAIIGYGLGWLILGRILPSFASRGRGLMERAVGKSVSGLSSWALSIPLARLVPPAGSPPAISLERIIADLFESLLASRETIYAVRDVVSRIVTEFSSRRVCDVGERIGISNAVAEKLLPALFAEPRRLSIGQGFGKLVAEQAGIVLSDEVLEEFFEVLENYLPEAADALVRWLQSPETRAVLSERGRELLPRLLEKLSEMQKFFVGAGQFDRRLAEKMPEIIDETIRAVEKLLRDPQQQERIAAAFFSSTREWRDALRMTNPEPGQSGDTARQKLADSASRVVDKATGRLGDPEVRHAIADVAARRVREDRRTMGAFLRDTFGARDADVIEAISSRVLRRLTGPETAREISRQICSVLFGFVRANGSASLGSALGIDPEKKRQLDSSLRAGVPRFITEILPVLSEATQARRRFGFIAGVFGASLGLVIGFVMVILQLLGYQL